MTPSDLQKPEIPIITIERDEEPQVLNEMPAPATEVPSKAPHSRWRTWLRWIALAFLVALIIIGAYIAFRAYVYYSPPDVSYAELPEQTIDNLQKAKKKKGSTIM